jgi:hypothetical protein
MKEAASLHPNWKVTGVGRYKHNGKRTGPRTLNTLLKWFYVNQPDKAEQIGHRIAAMLRFSGRVTVHRDRRN